MMMDSGMLRAIIVSFPSTAPAALRARVASVRDRTDNKKTSGSESVSSLNGKIGALRIPFRCVESGTPESRSEGGGNTVNCSDGTNRRALVPGDDGFPKWVDTSGVCFVSLGCSLSHRTMI